MRAEQLAKTSKDLMLKEPFYGMFLIMLNKRWDNDYVDTACVSRNGINFQLTLNDEFWGKLTDNQRRGLLKHELLHIGFFHITDFDHLTDHEIANVAQDIEINQYIDEADLPPSPLLPSTFPELNLLPRKGCVYYYEKLLQGKKNRSCPNLNSLVDALNSGNETFKVTIKGNGKGQPDTEGEYNVPDHSSWSEFDDLDEATQKLIKKQTEHILKEIADQVEKSRGTIPGEFQEILKRINTVEEPKFDWKSYLRRFAGGSTQMFTKKTRRKYNKRYEDNPGLKIKPKRHILFAVDTSGSVSTKELQECYGELHHIHKTGTEITIIQCDTAISYIGKFNYRDEPVIHGRGGTSFQPVIDYYNENLHKYTCLMYFTDGEAPNPTPARGRMLWVLSSKSNINESLIGPQIKLN